MPRDSRSCRQSCTRRGQETVWRKLQKVGGELVTAADVDPFDGVRKPAFLQQNDDLLAVSGGPEIKVNHRGLLSKAAGYTAGRVPAECGLTVARRSGWEDALPRLECSWK